MEHKTEYEEIAKRQAQEEGEKDLVCESQPVTAFQSTPDPIGESARRGKKQGEYTLEDYFALPEDKRYELIDGVLFAMSSPSRVHQALLVRLTVFFQNAIDENGGNSDAKKTLCFQ